MSDDHKKLIIARHETGHAVMALICRQGIQNVSLKEMDSPNGTDKYLGNTKLEPFDQNIMFTINEGNRRIMISLGGYASEILFYDSAKVGGDDLTFAAKYVEDMLQSEDFRNLVARLPVPDTGVFEMIENANVRAYIDYSMHICIQKLAPHKQVLQLIAEELYKKEELAGDEVSALFDSLTKSN